MAYNAVSQADLEVASNATDSDASRSPSPSPQKSFKQLPLDADHLGGSSYLRPALSAEDSSIGRLGSMIRSMTSTSYDMVEDDDYDIADPPADRISNSPRRVAPLDPIATHAASPEPPLRSPVTDKPTPLSHPTPDLQSLQGAYLNNVERLERSAEQLSNSSADIGSEIRRMDREQKRRSVSSASSYPVKGTDPSRHGSILSASRLAQVSENEPVGLYDPSANRIPDGSATSPQQRAVLSEADFAYPDQSTHISGEIVRPASAASGDTFQQARVLFTDFDGVHYVPHDRSQEPGRQVSLSRPPLASRPESYKEPRSGENMVYYPAPVPMMLNLPPRLSQKPNAEREKRRTQLLGSVPVDHRKSAPWLSGQGRGGANGLESDKQPTDLPPQLRASVFFEQPSSSLDVEVKQASAVATLDSILDASTTAPVSAFTDHPYAGHVGSEVYGSSKRKTLTKDVARAGSMASHQPYNPTEAEAADLHETTSLREGVRDGHDVDGAPPPDDSNNEEEVPFTGPPSTLLAELELRKHELRQRQRTAANSAGLHSTLLQLDAVAQKQSEHRRHRPVTLAWEGPDDKQDDEGDDDVPLAMLYPDKGPVAEEHRPLGLMEKREMEESEPLSRRRARLRGEPPPPPPPPHSPDHRPTTMYAQTVQEPSKPDSGDEGETLAQRLKRMKGKDRQSTATGSEFADEILAEIDHMAGKEEKTGEGAQGGGEEEETLGQRRARLQKEAESRNSTLKVPRYRRSMADLLHARRPVTARQPPKEATMHRASAYQLPYNNRMPPQVPAHAVPSRFAQYQGHTRAGSLGYGTAHPNTFYSDAILGMNHLSYIAPNQRAVRPGADPGQHEMIDRWRQSIV
ncbi:hypothetical protein BDV25DRAFT_166812 [Aspergillus avenaceus]|uniref:Uncharacterized protein n=1 Tax=Aspergillus avenaceus TaxID=36643 RepID=A0A5N6TDJ2_ASPAV|nr:hypothetical protein BDV25DRAFT_166812 [Aspergillus avenaceus]